MPFKSSNGHRFKKRDLNADLNLTSFIDLLSTCVCFLLITAVWTQINSMEIKQSHGTEASAETVKQLELDFLFLNTQSAKITLKGEGVNKVVTIASPDEQSFKSHLTQEFSNWLGVLGKEHKLKIASAMVHPASGVSYGKLVDALDVLRQLQITNIGIVPTKGE